MPARPRIAVLLALAFLCAAEPSRAAAEWKVIKIGRWDYLSVDNIAQFYGFPGKVEPIEKTIRLDNGRNQLEVMLDSREAIVNGVRNWLCFPVIEKDGKFLVSRIDLAKLIDPVLRPNFIQNAGDFRTVILDPGHGGKDPGATNPFGTESNYNVKVAGLVKKQLVAKGFKVVMTRDSNVYLSLQERVDFANAVQESAVYVSIHFNSGGSSARGIETFTLSPPGEPHYDHDFKAADLQTRAGNEHDSANIALATSVHGSILRRLGTNTLDRGIKRARFSVLSGVRHPAILLEGGFMSHPYEARLLEKPEYQNAIASGVVDAIGKYRFAVGHKADPAATN